MKTLFRFLQITCIFCLACTPGNCVANNQHSIKDSILIYKVQGLKEFIKAADYWVHDTESCWAFEQADSLLDSVLNLDNYEESLARIYAATSYVSYGLSYVPSVLEAGIQRVHGESESFPKVGIQESAEIIITDYTIQNTDTLFTLSYLESRALYSILYFFKAIKNNNFEESLLPNYNRSMLYKIFYSEYAPQTAYRLSTVFNIQPWYIYIFTCANLAHWENHNQAANIEEEPWKEFIERARWNDSLICELEKIVEMDDEEFHRIELNVAYSQYIMLSHAAKNLAEFKEKNSNKQSNTHQPAPTDSISVVQPTPYCTHTHWTAGTFTLCAP